MEEKLTGQPERVGRGEKIEEVSLVFPQPETVDVETRDREWGLRVRGP